MNLKYLERKNDNGRKEGKSVYGIRQRCVSGFCFMMGEKLTDELWSKLTAGEIAINVDEMGEEAQQIKLAFSAFAIAMVADKK